MRACVRACACVCVLVCESMGEAPPIRKCAARLRLAQAGGETVAGGSRLAQAGREVCGLVHACGAEGARQ